MLGLRSRAEVRTKVTPYIIVWMLCGFFVALIPSSMLVLNENLSFLKKVLPGGDFYYSESGMHASVLLLLLYEIMSMPILVYFVAKSIVKFGSAFSKQDYWIAALFLFMCPMGVFMAEGLWTDTGLKWGRVFLSLIQSGPLGVLVYFYFWFGCFVYGLTVLAVYVGGRRHEVSC